MTLAIELYIVLRLLLGAPLDTQVTKDTGLPSWYAPGERVIAQRALEEMTLAAEIDGILIWVNSAYRDYSYQAEVLSREEYLYPDHHRSFSAEPGHSEHQLGTTYDVAWPGLRVESVDPRNLELFQWLTENAHHYGFVISYPYKEIPDWPFHNRWLPVVTEYIHEPWHIRYIGSALAQEMWEAGYLTPTNPVLPQDFFTPWP
jgi:D-alanyl-D-alanine carboxypeptidase